MPGFTADYFNNKDNTSKGFTADYFKNKPTPKKPKDKPKKIDIGGAAGKKYKYEDPNDNFDPQFEKDHPIISKVLKAPGDLINGVADVAHKIPLVGNAMDFLDRGGTVATNSVKTMGANMAPTNAPNSFNNKKQAQTQLKKDLIKPKSTGNYTSDILADIGGEVGSYFITPGGNAGSLGSVGVKAGNMAKNYINREFTNPKVLKVLPQIVEGQVAGGTTSVLGDLMQGKSAKETLDNAVTGAGVGGFIDLGGAAIGKGLSKLGSKASKIIEKLPKNEVAASNEQTKVIKKVLKPSKDIKSIDGSKAIWAPSKTGNYDLIKLKQNLPLKNEIPIKPIAEIQKPKETKKSSFRDAYNNFYTRVVDSKNPLKPLGNETYVKAINSKNAGGTVDHILTSELVDRQGKKIGQSLKEIAESIPKNQEEDFWIYSRHKHNIARAKEGKPIYSDFTPEQSAIEVAKYEKLHPEFKNINKNVTSWIDSFMNEWGVNSGTIDKDLYSALRKTYPDYIPTQREFSELEKGISKTNGRGFVDQSAPLSKAQGSDRNLTPTLENIMNLVNRTVRTARYNEVGQSLLKSIRETPSNLAEIIPEGVEVKPNVKNVVTVLEDGKPVNIQINDLKLLNTLTNMTKSNDSDITNAAKKVAGIYKGLITQKNPIFALRNMARDIPTYIVNSSERNPAKALGNLISAGKDVVTNAESLRQYKGLGGGGSNFFNSNNVKKSVEQLTNKPNILKRGLNAVEKFNNLTETAPRLAEFKKVLKETNDPQKALYAASDVTTNFSRGGDLTKQVDAYVPYLNAAVQGLDKTLRQFKDRKIATVLKGATAITAPTLILNHINKDNPKYKELDNRTKDNYFLIPNGDTFIKIPKSRELGVLFSTLLERTLRQMSGEKNSFKGFNETVRTNFGPSNPLENNLASPILNLKSNKDFANRDIVPRFMKDQNLSPKYQYDEKTSEVAKKMGQLTNLSPKQIDYIIRSYTGFIGQLGLPTLTKSTYDGDSKANLLKPITSQFTSDPLYSNQALTDFYDNFDKLKQKAADKNFTEKLPSKLHTPEERLRGKFTKAQSKISDINKEIKNTTDKQKIKELRQKIIQIANDANNLLK